MSKEIPGRIKRRRLWTGEIVMCCPYCDYDFKTYRGLKTHMRIKHRKER